MSEDNDLYRAFGRVEGKIDLILTKSDAHEKRLDQHDYRIRSVENKLTYWAGGVTLLASAIAMFSKPILAKLFGV